MFHAIQTDNCNVWKLPILPLQMLVHTPNGNIPIVAKYLQQHGLLLDHPSSSWEPDRISHMLYLNPHNPPPGGHARSFNSSTRPGYPGPGGNRWVAQQVSGKSVEVQRNQVDEVFKIITNGEELEETDAGKQTCVLIVSRLRAYANSLGNFVKVIPAPKESSYISLGT